MLKSIVVSPTYALVVRNVTSPCAVGVGVTYRSSSTSTGSSSSSDKSSKGDFPPPSFDSRRGEMRSWQVHSYGGISDLQINPSTRIPSIKSPTDVLVQIKAASLNPIDLAMTTGYGSETLNFLRNLCSNAERPLSAFRLSSKRLIEFPLILGRDFAGTIVEMGHGARGKHGLRVGDEVYGVVGVQRQGSHAEYVVSSVDTIRRKPKNLNFVEAASIPYVGLTSWSALRVTGAYCNLAQKRFLVLGGSGGVGTFIVQYLKAHDAHVTTTCSSDAESLMASMGCDFVIDYKLPEFESYVKQQAPYDCILDLSGPTNAEKAAALSTHLKSGGGQMITLSPPFLSNIDKFGLLGGAVKNISDLMSANVKSWSGGGSLSKWAFFIPNGSPLESFAELLESKKIRPVVQEIFKFNDIPQAFSRLETGHLRGKLVIDFT